MLFASCTRTFVLIAVPAVCVITLARENTTSTFALPIRIRRRPAGIVPAELTRFFARNTLTVPASACGTKINIGTTIVAHFVFEALFVVVEGTRVGYL
jgi:hypothetical protein